MTGTRKHTHSAKESIRLVGESLDVADVSPSSQPLFSNTVIFETSQKHRTRPSSFQRLFSRPTATPRHDENTPVRAPEDLFDASRKMVGWPFSRSPRKSRPAEEEHATDPGINSPYLLTSHTAVSTSSLGSMVPADQQIFRLTSSLDSDELNPNASSSPVNVAPSNALEQPTNSDCRHAAVILLDTDFGNRSPTTVRASSNRSIIESALGLLSETRRFSEGTEASHSMVQSDPESFDEDPTPRASTFSPRAPSHHDPSRASRRRGQGLSLVVPPRDVDILSLRPAVGVAPHAPSETESSVSLYSPTSPTSPGLHGSPPTFPSMRPCGSETSSHVPSSEPPNPRIYATFPDAASLSNLESTPAISPGQCKRAMSPRSMTPPPSRRPPPTGPLPAVPSAATTPPVPPLPPLLRKISMNATAQSTKLSPPRPAIVGALPVPAAALPPSPPGGLRLPSRLSWINGVRAVLPSPPASPTRPFKSLTNRTPSPISPSKAEKQRPTSIGVIEAAGNAQVRRTKSILLLGSKSKSHASLGTKRVHIHADVNPDAEASRKPRRKSSSATVGGHPICASDPGPGMKPVASAELLVPRERRHSAPILSTLSPKIPAPSSDWTLSLPFCTDVPGNKLSPLLAPRDKPEEEMQGEDWTLCMPLKVRVDAPTVDATTGDGDSASCALADTSDAAGVRPTTTQLPTPSPSPSSSSFARALGPEEESVPEPEPEEEPEEEPRPASPVASLGPHVGGLDLAGGRGKRASGWHVYGWFDEVCVAADEHHHSMKTIAAPRPLSIPASVSSDGKLTKTLLTAFRKAHDVAGRQSSQDSMSTVSTSETMFYSARSSLLVN